MLYKLLKIPLPRSWMFMFALARGSIFGLPSMIGRSKKSTFNYIKDCVGRKINSWSSRCFSRAGREALIKSVLQAISTYIMSIFLILESIGVEIQKKMNSFWWGSNGRGKGMKWLSWDKLSINKENGGMRFCNLYAFNLSMLGKQGWRLMTDPNSFTSILLKAKYFPRCDFVGAQLGHNPSFSCFSWRSIWSSKALIKEGYKRNSGAGDKVSLWTQPWLCDGLIFLMICVFKICKSMTSLFRVRGVGT